MKIFKKQKDFCSNLYKKERNNGQQNILENNYPFYF